MKSKRTKKNTNKTIKSKNKNNNIDIVLIGVIIILLVGVFIILNQYAEKINNNQQTINQQLNNESDIVNYNFKITNLYPANIYGELGSGIFANITEYDQYRIFVGGTGNINITFNFSQNAKYKIILNISYLKNETNENIVINGLNGTKQIIGQTVPSIITITVINYGKEPLNGNINTTINYNHQ